VTEAPAKTPIPSRTDHQRREALAGANQLRTARSRLKEQLKRKEVSLASLVADCPSYLATAKVNELLQAVPGCGPVKATNYLASCRISPTKTMAGLTPRQRQALVEALEGCDLLRRP
jgi:transposase